MNGQVRRFDQKKYIQSLEDTVYEAPPKVKIDMRGLIAYAASKKIDISELSHDEKMRFATFY